MFGSLTRASRDRLGQRVFGFRRARHRTSVFRCQSVVRSLSDTTGITDGQQEGATSMLVTCPGCGEAVELPERVQFRYVARRDGTSDILYNGVVVHSCAPRSAPYGLQRSRSDGGPAGPTDASD